eukprot:TRINITY_DN42037_c0_g1_i1.p1 TRINITY_DN42037_c0_g1~~TRINITY_DN42037_c0_g1_i1.p1  ORF type:complete len:226 (+),score=13.20 TRINITY_DN42037_c0_g1_i1:103-780(+)
MDSRRHDMSPARLKPRSCVGDRSRSTGVPENIAAMWSLDNGDALESARSDVLTERAFESNLNSFRTSSRAQSPASPTANLSPTIVRRSLSTGSPHARGTSPASNAHHLANPLGRRNPSSCDRSSSVGSLQRKREPSVGADEVRRLMMSGSDFSSTTGSLSRTMRSCSSSKPQSTYKASFSSPMEPAYEGGPPSPAGLGQPRFISPAIQRFSGWGYTHPFTLRTNG